MVPLLNFTSDEPPQMIYKLALTSILGIGTKLWDAAITGGTKADDHMHGLAGKPSNRCKNLAEVHESLHNYFSSLKNEGIPFAKRVIREETGTMTRDDDPDAVCLPPHMSKRRCYASWCWERV
mmetsp:Transcript_15652/g.23710  ORF Transcript_15652/g.23710 Transcript_15652/m.23710 type:complete len:123 (+) Transcript_15652:348-716(+)